MLTRKGEAAPARTGTASTPKCDPRTTTTKPKGNLHSSAQSVRRPVVGSREAPHKTRWTRRPRPTTVLSDVIVWATWLIITAAELMALCILLAIVWPA